MGHRKIFIMIVAAAVACMLGADTVHAINKCKVKVDNKTGVLLVSASGVGGVLKWGGALGQETNTFFNDVACLVGGKAKKCELADPATLAAETAPADCRIYLDDGVAACNVRVKGCMPGPRIDTDTDTNGPLTCQNVTTVQSVVSAASFNLSPTCPAGTTITGGGNNFGGFATGLWWWQSSQAGNGWTCRGINQSAGQTASVTCYARCCSVP